MNYLFAVLVAFIVILVLWFALKAKAGRTIYFAFPSLPILISFVLYVIFSRSVSRHSSGRIFYLSLFLSFIFVGMNGFASWQAYRKKMGLPKGRPLRLRTLMGVNVWAAFFSIAFILLAGYFVTVASRKMPMGAGYMIIRIFMYLIYMVGVEKLVLRVFRIRPGDSDLGDSQDHA